MLLAGMPAPVIAAPEEIQVYTDDINAPGEFGLELHVNYVLEGPRAPVYAGQVPTNHVLQVTIMSRTVNLNPLAVLVSVLIGVELFGFLGARDSSPVAIPPGRVTPRPATSVG